MKCTYALFCEDINFNSSTRQLSAEKIFSSLTLDGPGTTKFSFLVGVTGIKKGLKETLIIKIISPNNRMFSGKWASPESQDEYEVYNAVFNVSGVPLEVSGLYKFIISSEESEEEIARRVLKVKIRNQDKGEDNGVT